MTGLLIIVFLVFAAGGVLAGAFWNARESRKQARQNLDKGLQMVPLLIHLPPISEDTSLSGRDERDVVDETISKAQIIYNIIASATQESGKSKSNDDKEISFEIVGTQGFVYFYASVAVGLVSVVKQAIVSAYPSAQVEETLEHNIFNQVGGATAVTGGEMALKEPYAFPIATYQDLKRDAMQSILNSLASLNKEDGVAVQMIFRPADKKWRKAAIDVANKKRKGKYDTKSGMDMVGPLAKQMVTALVKPPEGDKEKESSSDLSGLDRSVVDAIEDKTRYPGFEVCIRVVTSSNISQRSQAILQNIVAAFGLFDAPGKNGFKFEATKDTQQLINNYLLRSFSGQRQKIILNAVELATLFHFPDQNNIPTSQLVRQASKQVDGPRNIPEDGLLLGYNVFRGAKKPIRLALQDRQRHMYVVGQTGTGKSTFLENLALQDMLNGNGFAFVDPHGDTAEKLLSMVPKERTEDVIYFSPADMAYPMGLNLFEYNNPDQKDFLIQEALNMLYKLYDPQHQGIMGPRYEHLFRMAALTVMADPRGGTFIDIPKLFRDPTYVKQKLEHVKDQNVIEFWQKEMPQSQRSNEFGEVVSWFVSKFGAFLSNEMMRNIIGQTKSAFDLRDVMDNKKILLVNLSKGRTGELNSKLLGMIFVMKFQAAAMSRANVPEDQRQDFTLYVDEFQNFSTDSFATIMSEARKYHLNLTVANQFTTQLTEEIRDAVFGNMGTIVSFRIGQNDVDSLSKYFQPIFDGDDLLRVPNYNTIVRTLVSGVPTQPFSMATLPPLGNPNSKLSQALKQLSAAKYGRPRGSVEDEIFTRMKTLTPPRPASQAFGPPGPGGGPGNFGRPSVGSTRFGGGGSAASLNPTQPLPATPRPSSFLDDWLQKRKSVAPMPPPAASTSPAGDSTPYDPLTNVPVRQPTPASMTPPEQLPPHQPLRTGSGMMRPSSKESTVTPKNISSEAIDKKEIGEIAEELKQSLQATPPTTELPGQGVAPDKPPVDQDAADTISIDAEGNLVIKKTDD